MCADGAAARDPPTKPSGIESGFPPFPLHVFCITKPIAREAADKPLVPVGENFG